MLLIKTGLLFLTVIILTTMSSRGETSENWIRDDDGRALILHGLNISNAAKVAPDYLSWHTFEDYERMKKDWGFNVVRYLIFWSAVEPEPGIYDDDFLDSVAERVDWARELGLHVIIDMHQDLYGVKFGSDGAPEWATEDDGLPYDPWETWYFNYLQPAVMRAFTNLWTGEELKDHLIGAWVHVAERFAGNAAVLGYDLFNEPSSGEFWPWTFEKYYLAPFYLDLIAAMKTVDPDHTYFYEPQITTSAGGLSYLGVLEGENLAYAPHYYHPLVAEGYFYSGNSWLLWLTMKLRNAEAARSGIPWILGEFGVPEDLRGMRAYLFDLLSILDYRKAGWTYWSYDYSSDSGYGIIDSEGNEQDQLECLVRPYPMRISGLPVSYSYSPYTRILQVEFDEEESAEGPTEIYTGGSRIYPEGFEIYCSDDEGSWSYELDEEWDIIKVWTSSEFENHVIILKAAEGFKISTDLLKRTDLDTGNLQDFNNFGSTSAQ